ncbi:MAG: hypothetical protein ACE5IE_00615 [Dehalococcoidia bacterium]
MNSSEKLADSMKRLFLRIKEGRGFDFHASPGCAFGAVVEERLKDLERDIHEVKGRINGLIFLVIAAVVVQVIIRIVG